MAGRRSRFYVHQGKDDLLSKLGAKLRGYARWLPERWRMVVIVDCDDDDCKKLKEQLDSEAELACLRTRTRVSGGLPWQVANRIAIEELACISHKR